jgi:hypothetical protein
MPLLLPRRRLVSALAAGLTAFTLAPLPARAAAEDVRVPIELQAKLLAKVATFDRNMASRAGEKVVIVVARLPDDPESGRAAARLQLNLSQLRRITDKPVDVRTIDFANAADLARACKSAGAAIVYLTPGMQSALTNIASALDGMSILSVSAVAEHVTDGAVLAFGLSEGKPKILIHLGRAKRQNVDFKASILRLAQVVDT